MDERIARIVTDVAETTLVEVASSILGLPVTRLDAPATFAEIRKPHAEERTIGIVRVSGRADGRDWSSVIKLVDLAIAGAERVAGMTRPENEELVYERKLFADDGLRFRPARCHAITRPQERLKLLWLEDLTTARGAPFSVEQVQQIARHLGEWNGHHIGALPDLGFAIGEDAFAAGVSGWNFPKWMDALDAHQEHQFMRATFSGSHRQTRTLLSATGRLLDRVRTAPHALAFGDCSIGNVFFTPNETIAIDWASLTDDPIGVDGGRLIGSSFTWGADFMSLVKASDELFDSYLGGLRAGGWRGDTADIRRAVLAQVCSYYLTTSIVPVLLITGDDFMRNFLTGRFGLPPEEICTRLSELIATVPALVAEVDSLLAQ